MSKSNTANRSQENKIKNYALPIIAGVVVVAAAAVVAVTKLTAGTDNADSSSQAAEQSSVQAEQIIQTDGELRISADSLSEEITFVDYDSNGTAMQLMLLKTSDGKIRCALNTCQVCYGSPYAYFVQSGDTVVCQNCRNTFSLDQIGDASNGCNPIPFEYSEDGGDVVIDTAALDQYAPAFTNWKKGI